MKAIATTALQVLSKNNWTLGFCDEAAMSIALNSDVILTAEKQVASVELCGTKTRGQVAVDWRNSAQARANANFVRTYNVTKLQEILLKSIQ